MKDIFQGTKHLQMYIVKCTFHATSKCYLFFFYLHLTTGTSHHNCHHQHSTFITVTLGVGKWLKPSYDYGWGLNTLFVQFRIKL